MMKSYWLSQYNVFRLKMHNSYLNLATGISRIVFTIPIIYLLFKFLTKDIFKLASVKH